MEIFTPAHSFETWFGRLSVHQDFFWFVSLLSWSLALIAWWRHPERSTHWTWLGAGAATAIATALIHFGMFNPGLTVFQERLIPGTISDYRPATINPYGLGDGLLGFALAMLTAGWAWQVCTLAGHRRRRVLIVALMTGLGATNLFAPHVGGWLLTLTAPILALALARLTTGSRASRVGLGLIAFFPLFSTVGPVAFALGMLQRHGPPTPMGLASALYQSVAGVFVAAILVRSLLEKTDRENRRALWLDARGFLWTAIALLIAGVTFGVIIARDNRNEILENRLRTTAAHATVFEPDLLKPLDREEFWRIHLPSNETNRRKDPAQLDGAEPARQRLHDEMMATPFIQEARILVLRDGWLIAALSSESGSPVEYLRRATADDVARWHKPAPYYEESPVPEIGYDYYTRAPILAEDGRMLGWLEAVRDEFYLTVERRWRAAPFLITALGVVILAMLFAQRRSTREREKALRAAAIAAESNRIKTTFFANVSHELRTPLQNILGYSELLQRELPPEAAARSRLHALHAQGELMKRLVNDLIDLSAVEAGAFQLAPRPVSPGALVTQTIESLRPRATAKNLELHATIEANVPPWIAADGERLRQIVLNLTGNALKFTERGHVHASLSVAAQNDAVVTLRFSVSDTGPGIPASQQTRLFQPFSRLAQTAEKEGSGLGLALCRALCHAMAGDLSVESDGLSGSHFSATFAASLATKPSEETFTPVPVTPERQRVLVVDDNTLVRELFTGFLQGQGAHSEGVSTVADALAAAGRQPWDVVLLDLALPDGSGADFVQPLRALQPAARIIGVSAHAGLAEREHALAAGMDAFLVKPVELDALWRMIAHPAEAAGTVGGPASAPVIPAVSDALLAAFARELPGKRRELDHAIAALDWPRIRATAHYLRNSALVVQARDLFDACTQIEAAAEKRDAGALHASWERHQPTFEDRKK